MTVIADFLILKNAFQSKANHRERIIAPLT